MEITPTHKPDFAKGFNEMMKKMAETEAYELWRFKCFVEDAKKRHKEVFVFVETEVNGDPTVILIDDIDVLRFSEEKGHFVFTKDVNSRQHTFWGGIKRGCLPKDVQRGFYFEASLLEIPDYKEPTVEDVLKLEPVGELDLWTLFETVECDLREGTHGVDWVEKDEKGRLKVEILVRSQDNARGYEISRVVFDEKHVALMYIDGRKDYDVLDAQAYQDMLNYIEDEWGVPVKVTPLDKSLMGYFGVK